MKSTRIAAVVIAFVALTAFASADVCSFTSGSTFQPSTIASCFNAVPLSQNVKTQTIAQLRQLVELYAFTDVVGQSGEPFFVSVNLRAELDRIDQTTYSSDYAFQDDLRSVFAQLGDAHTLYYGPVPYRQFFCAFPFVFQGSVNDAGAFIITATAVTKVNGQDYPSTQDLTPFVGQRVLSINGMDVVQWVQARGDQKGYSRSSSTRFNVAFLYNMPLLYMGMGGPLPTTDTWTIVFAGGQSLTVNTVCSVKQTFLNVADLQSKIMGARAGSLVSLAAAEAVDPMASTAGRHRHTIGHANLQHLLELQMADVTGSGIPAGVRDMSTSTIAVRARSRGADRVLSFVDHAEVTAAGAADLTPVATNSDSTASCWEWPAQNAVMMRYSAFLPDTVTDDHALSQWMLSVLQVTEQCLTLQVQKSYPRVILDLRHNGGGLVCMSMALPTVLFPQKYYPFSAQNTGIFEPSDIRKSTPLGDGLVAAAGGFRIDPASGQQVNNNSWYAPTVTRSLGFGYSPYTPKGYFPSECYVSAPGSPSFSAEGLLSGPPVTPTFTELLVVTDGLCGSACSQFSTRLRYHGNSRIVTVGGAYQQPMESSSFTGGNVLDWTPFVQSLPPTPGLSLLPTTASTRFNFNAMYAGSQPLWREFTPIYGDYHIDRWDFASDPIYTLTPYQYSFVTTASPVLIAAAATFNDAAFISGRKPLGAPYRPVPLEEQGITQPTAFIASLGAVAAVAAVFLAGMIFACVAYRNARKQQAAGESTALVHNSA